MNTKIKILPILLLLAIANIYVVAQGKIYEKRIGKISFISSQHVYVQFENTESIKVGDTLFTNISSKIIPALIVKYISSRSCAGEKIIPSELKPDDLLYAKTLIKASLQKNDNNKNDTVKSVFWNRNNYESQKQSRYVRKNYSGRLSLQSLSSYSNTMMSDDQRWRYSFSFYADSIAGTGLSFSSYLFFAYNTQDWSNIRSNIGDALKFYDLSLGYTFQNKNKIWIGRYLNPKISNVGSIDGIQYQNQMGNYYLGAVVGSHPDFADYGYNAKMFEYGGYFGRIDTIASSQMENSIAFMNQTNNFNTDRRYLYFQHTNNLIDNTSLFASTEFDLYKIDNGVPQNIFTLTSLFVNLYVTPVRFLSFSISFDERRNAIYYETYKTYLESLLSNELRKGYRFSLYLRPMSNISVSLNGGYSFQSGDVKASNNFGGNLYCAEIPLLGLSGNLTYSKLNSSYTNGTIAGGNLNKYVSSLDLNLTADYKNIKYEFDSGVDPIIQNIVSVQMSFKLPFDLYFGLNYEGVFEKINSYGRFYIDLTKRF